MELQYLMLTLLSYDLFEGLLDAMIEIGISYFAVWQ